MSRISDVIRNKNIIERTHKARRKAELSKLKEVASYKASLSEAMRHVSVLLESPGVDAVIISLDDSQLKLFSAEIYSDEMSSYDIQQVPNKPNAFIIRYKLI